MSLREFIRENIRQAGTLSGADLNPNRSLRKSLFAGKVEAAGIEPALVSPPNSSFSSGFVASVLLGAAGRSHILMVGPRGLILDGERLAGLEDAIPKLEFLLKAARLQT